MMNDVKALSDAPPSAGLIEFLGAYHTSEDGQVCQAAKTACKFRPSEGLRLLHLTLPDTPSLSAPFQARGAVN